MSGGGKIMEKLKRTLPESGREVVQYRVMHEYRPDWFDETCVMAEPAETEPGLGDTIWWGGDQVIYWGDNDARRLTKIGYSFRPKPEHGGE